MALIEHLERDNWKEFFSETFGYVLWTLRHDRFRHVGSAADDLRSWLALGGIPRVRHHLEWAMRMCEFPEERAIEVMKQVDQLVSDNRSELIGLARDGIIPGAGAPDAEGLSVADIDDALQRIERGERPFEEWMYAHGHTYDEVVEVYKSIDKWLVDHGIVDSPGPLPKRQ
ncbi:MAG: hypothetical protein OXH99_19555 [Bryobacterales bacterium]|nr:hypothetical protein [Bryobacterales bacterium]